MNILNKMIVVLLILWCLTGCATIFNGRTQRIRVDSNIPGATVKIDDTIVGQTPFLGDIPRSKKNRVLTVQAHSFEPQSQSMRGIQDRVKTLGTTLLGSTLLVTGQLFLTTADNNKKKYYEGEYSYSIEADREIGLFMIGGSALSLTSSTVDRMNGSAYQYTPSSFYFHFADEYGTNTDEIIIRKYAMLNHSQIAIDAQDENGEYLNALVDMMSRKMSRDEAIESIKVALEYSEGDQLAFGDEIVDSFRYHH